MIYIHKAKPADLNNLIQLLSNQFAEHDIELASKELRDALEIMLKNDSLGLCLLAEKDGQPVGFAAISLAWTLEYGGKTAWLDELYVLATQRSAGIGNKLMDAVIAECQSLGCHAIDLEVEEEHERAEHLYQRKGFESLNRSRWVKKIP